MKKTKKALLAALACSAALAGAAFGLSACDNGGGHSHSWNEWTVTTQPTKDGEGKATRTCKNGGCNATDADKEYTLPALESTDYSKTEKKAANCTEAGADTYTYDKDGVQVSFDVATAVNPDGHDYKYVSDGAEGHHGVCKHNDEHITEVKAHDNKGADGECSACGYHAIALNTDTAVSGATANKPKRYFITLAANDYQLIVGGKAVDTGADIAFGTLEEDKLTEIESAGYDKLLSVKTEGLYCVEVYKDVTFKIIIAPPHEHAFDETEWTFDKTGHWHAAICGHDTEKGSFAQHTMDEEWSAADSNGVQFKRCATCDYTEYNYNATALNGGGDIAVNVTGNYSTVVHAELYMGKYYSETTQEYSIRNGDTAKMYTIKVLTENTRVYNLVEQYATFSVVLEANQKFSFSFGSSYGSFDEVPQDFELTAAFRVTVEDAPEAGDVMRPVSVKAEGAAGKDSAEANEKVYMRLEGGFNEPFNQKDVKMTFGEGVKVYLLGEDIDGTPEEIESGDYVSLKYADYYLYAVSENGGECKVNFETFIAPGKKGNPIPVTVGGENNPVNLSDSFEQWYKLDGLTAGTKYILKTTHEESSVELYDSLTGSEPVSSAESGTPLVIDGTADTLYVKVKGSGTFSFTVAEVTDADRGIAPGLPIELTDGEYDVHAGAYFYMFNTTKHGVVTFTYEDAEKQIQFWKHGDANYESYGSSMSRNNLRFTINNSTGYIRIVNGEGATGKFTFRFAEYVAHDYVVTLDGIDDVTGVTVKLTYTDYMSVTHEIASTSNSGKAFTFTDVDPSRYYSVVVEGLNGYDYYSYEMTVPSNTDSVTAFTAKLYATQEYKVKVVLPDGSMLPDGATLEGLQVRFALAEAESEPEGPGGRAAAARADSESLPKNVALTDANGVATIKLLDPFVLNEDGDKIAASYVVSVTVPKGHSLEGKFAYYVKVNSEDEYEYVKVDAENRDITATPLTLTALVEYTVTLKDGENNFAEGQKVSVNGTVYTVGSDGTFKISLRPEVQNVTITIEDYVIDGTVTFDKEGKTITATFNPYSNALELGVAKEFKDAGSFEGVSFELTVTESGEYTFTFGGGLGEQDATVTVEYGEDMIYDEGEGFALEAGKKYTVTIYNAGWSGTISGTVTVTKADNSANTLTLGEAKEFTDVGYSYTVFSIQIEEAGNYTVTIGGDDSAEAFVAIAKKSNGEDEIYENGGSYSLTAGKYYVCIASNKMEGNLTLPISGTVTVNKVTE